MRVRGFRAAGVACGLKQKGGPDLALVVSDRPAVAAGRFTRNRVQAAPVVLDREVLGRSGARFRAIAANAGCANACTGEEGMAAARAMAAEAARLAGCRSDEVLVLSTGVIGAQLPVAKVVEGLGRAAAHLAPDGWDAAARAIMTTDTRPKLARREVAGGSLVGIAKGSGMIAPHLATMLAIVVTDLVLDAAVARALLARACDESFERIVVDGDMSPNDSVLLLANGAAQPAPSEPDPDLVAEALTELCQELAREIVRDGEGATKCVRVEVTGAETDEAAAAVAQAIARSPLCKTAFYGADPNWGRIASAAGAAGVELAPERLRLELLVPGARSGVLLAVGGRGSTDGDREAAAREVMAAAEWTLRLDLGLGGGSWWLWTCDLSHAYVTINGHYRT